MTDRLVDPGNCYGEQEETAPCREEKCPGTHISALNMTNCTAHRKVPFAGNLLMIVGGRSAQGSEDKGYVKRLDDPSRPLPHCLSSICDFEYYFEGAATAMFDGLPTICGGRNSKTSPHTYHKECWKFSFANGTRWVRAGTKNYDSIHAGKYVTVTKILQSKLSTIITGVQTDWGLVVAGGYRLNEGSKDTMEFSSDGTNWETIETRVPGKLTDFKKSIFTNSCFLAEPRYGACQVALDRNNMFLGGGHVYGVGDLNTGKYCNLNI